MSVETLCYAVHDVTNFFPNPETARRHFLGLQVPGERYLAAYAEYFRSEKIDEDRKLRWANTSSDLSRLFAEGLQHLSMPSATALAGRYGVESEVYGKITLELSEPAEGMLAASQVAANGSDVRTATGSVVAAPEGAVLVFMKDDRTKTNFWYYNLEDLPDLGGGVPVRTIWLGRIDGFRPEPLEHESTSKAEALAQKLAAGNLEFRRIDEEHGQTATIDNDPQDRQEVAATP